MKGKETVLQLDEAIDSNVNLVSYVRFGDVEKIIEDLFAKVQGFGKVKRHLYFY